MTEPKKDSLPNSRSNSIKRGGTLKSGHSSLSKSGNSSLTKAGINTLKSDDSRKSTTLTRRISKMRLSMRIKKFVDEKILDDRHTDDALINNIPDNGQRNTSVSKSSSLRADDLMNHVTSPAINRNRTTGISFKRKKKGARRGHRDSHTISTCHFDLQQFDKYSRKDVPALAEHFCTCADPTHILPTKKHEHIACSSKFPFVKVKTEEVPDKNYTVDNVDDEIEEIIKLLIEQANHYNKESDTKESDMREVILNVRSNMRWYLVHRLWEAIKRTSKQISWTDLLNMIFSP